MIHPLAVLQTSQVMGIGLYRFLRNGLHAFGPPGTANRHPGRLTDRQRTQGTSPLIIGMPARSRRALFSPRRGGVWPKPPSDPLTLFVNYDVMRFDDGHSATRLKVVPGHSCALGRNAPVINTIRDLSQVGNNSAGRPLDDAFRLCDSSTHQPKASPSSPVHSWPHRPTAACDTAVPVGPPPPRTACINSGHGNWAIRHQRSETGMGVPRDRRNDQSCAAGPKHGWIGPRLSVPQGSQSAPFTVRL